MLYPIFTLRVVRVYQFFLLSAIQLKYQIISNEAEGFLRGKPPH